ncbi:MAG: hypothetical protein OER86_00760 [Phycisphaerae bacterium]|nr:hypothetical protein [Phycisphaerae bacterium]
MRNKILALILLIQWTGFYLLESPDPSSGGGLLTSFLGYFANAVENGGAIFFLALAMWVARRAGSFDWSVASQAAVLACLASFLPAGRIFYLTALPTLLAAALVMGWINKTATARAPWPAVAVTLVTLVLFRLLAWGVGSAESGGPFLSVPGYGTAHWAFPLLLAAALAHVLVGLACRARRPRPSAQGHPRDTHHDATGRGTGAAHIVAAVLCIPAAITHTAREGSASWSAMAGLEIEAVAALLLAGAACGPVGRSLRACFLAALNLAVFDEGMVSLGIRLGEWFPSTSTATLDTIILCARYGLLLLLIACLWSWHRSERGNKKPATETPSRALS